MTVSTEREALPFRRRKWLAFLDCGAAAELPLLPPPTTSTATSSASVIPRASVEQQYNRCDTDNEIAGAFRALNPRPSSALGAKDAQPHDTKGPRRPASAKMRLPGTADAALQSSTRGARPPSPAGEVRRLRMPPRLGPGRGPPPCCPQCGLTRFPRGPPPPPLLRGRVGGGSYPPRPFMGPRRHFPGGGMPPRPGMWWVGRGSPPPRPGMGRGPRGPMRGGYGRGRGRGGSCFCNAMGPMRGMGGRPLPRPGRMVGPPPGRGGRGRGVKAGPGRSCDRSSAALLSCARPEARPEDEEDFAQPATPVSSSNSATKNDAGFLMKISSRRGGLTVKAAPADSAVSLSVKPNNQKIEGTASKHFDFGQGGPMLEGGMPKGRPKSAPPVIAGSTRPEESKAGSNLLPYQGGLPDRLQPAVARTTAAPTGMAKGGREKEITRTVADGPTGGLDCPQHVARLINGATTEANASCQPIDATTSGHADGGASSEVEDVGSLTAATPKCEASAKASTGAEGRGGRELAAPHEGTAADRPAPPLCVEDLLAAALQGKCIVLAGGGAAAAAAAPGGGWLVAAATTPGRLTANSIDNDNRFDVVAQVEREGEGPKTATSCTQWEENDVLAELVPKVPARTLPQLWANKSTPTVSVFDPILVESEDKPATKPDAKAAAVGGRDWTNGSDVTNVAAAYTAAAPATGSSSSGSALTASTSGEGSAGGRLKPSSTSSKGCRKPSATDTASTEWPTPSTLAPPKGDDIEQDGGDWGCNNSPIAARVDCGKGVKGTTVDLAGAMSAVGSGPEGRPAAKSTLGIQTDDLESGQDAVLGGINGGHPWMIASRPSDLDGRVTARAPSPPKAVITAEVDEQVAGGRVPQAEAEEVESLSLPNSLGDAAASRPFLHQEEIVSNHVEAAKDVAANTLRGGGRGGLDPLLPQAACAKEVPTTTAQTSWPSREASSMGRNSPGEGGGVGAGGLDASPVTIKEPNCQTKRLPSSNTTNHNVQMAPASKPMAAAPLAAPGVGTTPLSGRPGVAAENDDVPHEAGRSFEAGESLTNPSGPAARPMVGNSSGINVFPEEGEERDGHADKGDEAGDGPVVVEMKETQTEDDIDAAVRKADAPQLLFRARPWDTQLEHEFVPDDSAGESFGSIIVADTRIRRLSDTTAAHP